MKIKSLAVALWIITLFVCSACVGRNYSDIMYDEKTPKAATTHILIEAQLLNHSGQPVQGISIAAETSHSVDSDISNSEGKALLNVVLEEEQGVDFHFTSKSADWTTNLMDIQRGTKTMRVIFKMTDLGKIYISAIEY